LTIEEGEEGEGGEDGLECNVFQARATPNPSPKATEKTITTETIPRNLHCKLACCLASFGFAASHLLVKIPPEDIEK